MRNLIIKKETPYLWRVNSAFSQVSHNHVDSWIVEDADTGEILIGGHTQGNNCRSGSVGVERKKHAVAFIAGYHAFEQDNGLVDTLYNPHYPEYVGVEPEYKRKRIGWGKNEFRADRECADHFKYGAIKAWRVHNNRKC